jgi:hypothetical protein
MLTLHLYDSSDRRLRQWGYVGTTQPGIIYTGVSGYQDIENELRRIGGLGGKKLTNFEFTRTALPASSSYRWSD